MPKHQLRSIGIFLVIATGIVSALSQAECIDYTRLASYMTSTASLAMPGVPSSVTETNGYAYVAASDVGLVVVDVSDPFAPQIVASLDTPGSARNVTVVGDRAYVADYDQGMHIVDISDPSSPAIVGSVDTPGSAVDVAVAGNYAYIADRIGGPGGWARKMQVVDISDPANPWIVAGGYSNGAADAVELLGNYAYTADQGGLMIYDVSTPTSPVWIGQVTALDDAEDFVIANGYAYLVEDYSGLEIMDLSNPTAPVSVGSVNTPDRAARVAVVGDHAYVADGWSGGVIDVDVSDPSNPQILGSYIMPLSATGVAVAGGYAYASDLDGYLEIVSITHTAPPAFEAPLPLNLYTGAMAYDDGLLYVAEGGAELKLIDYTNPDVPTTVSTTLNWRGFGRIAVQNDICYALGEVLAKDQKVYSPWFFIMDCTNAASPIARGEVALPTDNLQAVDVSGSFAYVATDIGLSIVDVSDLDTPTVAGSLSLAGGATSCVVDGSHVYLGTYSGVVVVDVSNPASPLVIQTVPGAGDVYDLSLAGANLYCASGVAGLVVVDVADPTSAYVLQSLSTYGTAYGLESDGQFAYIADYPHGLYVADVRVPYAPVELLTLAASGYPRYMLLTPDRALLGHTGGFYPFIRQCMDGVVSVGDLPGGRLGVLDLRCAPNPFNPQTFISFDLPAEGATTVEIYDLTGRRVQTLVDKWLQEGNHTVVWNGRDASGRRMPSNVYLSSVRSGGVSETRKITLLK